MAISHTVNVISAPCDDSTIQSVFVSNMQYKIGDPTFTFILPNFYSTGTNCP